MGTIETEPRSEGGPADRLPQIVLVRHGETAWSRTGQHTGLTDVPLTYEGRQQAGSLGAHLRSWRFAQVLSSPLRRALDTCRLAGLGDGVELVEALHEWDYGSYEGRTTSAIRSERPGWSLWRDGAPGGETAEQVASRIQTILTVLRQARGDVAVFAHGHVLRVLATCWLGLAPVEGRRFVLEPAAVGVLGYERETPVLLRWNQRYGPGANEPELARTRVATEA